VRENRGRILVVRGGAIGDFILTLPVLAALRDQFAEAELEVLGYPHIARLALLGGLAQGVHSIEARPLAGFFARNGDLDPDLADYFSGFALIVSYLYDPDEVFRTNVSRCSNAQFIAGPHRPDESLNLHATEVFLKPLECLAIFGADPVPRLNAGQDSEAPAEGSPMPSGCAPAAGGKRGARLDPVGPATVARLALHPGSGSETKNWPEPLWRDLLERLARETRWDFLVVGGEAEGARLERLGALLPAGRLQIARNLPLPELAVELAACAAFVGHDSGITHLAAAVGLPGLALWGPTKVDIWRPLGDQMKVLSVPDGLDALSVERVAAELATLGLPVT
jgi:heptosyltransferase-2